ncbi:MAG: ATP-binding protein, partial [bacterium]
MRQITRLPDADSLVRRSDREIFERLARFETDLSGPLAHLEPEKRKNFLFSVVQRTLIKLSETGSVCLLLDDYQWLDAPSREFLDWLASQTVSRPILFAFTTRPMKDLPYRRRPFYQERALSNWSLEEVKQVIADLHPGCSNQTVCIQKLFRQTQGNPLFLREVLSALPSPEQFGALDLDTLKLPGSISRAILSKMDTLSREAQHLAARASVLGDQFSLGLLERISGDPSGFQTTLEQLLADDLFVRVRRYPEPLYEFVNPMFQKVLSENMLKKDRAEAHLRAAAALESATRGSPARALPRIAAHYLEGGDAERAFRKFIEAGELALEQYAVRDAVQFFQKAKEALAPDAQAELDWRVRWYRGIGVSLSQAGSFKDALAPLNEYAGLAKKAKDKDREADALILLGSVQVSIGQPRKALQSHTEAVKIALRNGTPVLEAEALFALGITAMALGRLSEAKKALTGALEIFKDHPHSRFEPKATDRLGYVYKELGQFPEALRYARRALEIAKKNHDPPGEAMALSSIGGIYGKWGRYDDHIGVMKRARAIHQTIGDAHGAAVCSDNIGYGYQMVDRPEEACAIYEESLQYYEQTDSHKNLAFTCCNLGEAYWGLGRYADALACNLRGKEVADRAGFAHEAIINTGALANLYTELGDYSRALRLLRILMGKIHRFGMLEFIIHGALLHSRILREIGRPEDAVHLLQTELKKPALKEALGHASLQAQSTLERGMVNLALGKRIEASKHLEAALRQARQANDRLNFGIALLAVAGAMPAKFMTQCEEYVRQSPYKLLDFKYCILKARLRPGDQRVLLRARKWRDSIARSIANRKL